MILKQNKTELKKSCKCRIFLSILWNLQRSVAKHLVISPAKLHRNVRLHKPDICPHALWILKLVPRWVTFPEYLSHCWYARIHNDSLKYENTVEADSLIYESIDSYH